MKYDMFIADYDGTLGDFGGINAETVKAIKEYERRGGIFAICSGRMFKNVRDICNNYGIASAVVSYQGARINERESGKLLFGGEIEKGLAVEVLSSLKGLPVKPAVLSDEYIFYTQTSPYIEAYKIAKIVELKQVNDLAKAAALGEFAVLKINVICGEENKADFISENAEKYKGKLIVNSGGESLAEFINPNCSKGKSVEFLANHFGIPKSKVITVGDSTNDIELVRGEWHGVAVGDAKEELKKYAKEVTVDYKNNPVKFLLEKYCL
ncbi:MAG: HAD family hydrolase [Clostridia bacterium]|nr:HAD family hydrolase [Clostridia bacterium]